MLKKVILIFIFFLLSACSSKNATETEVKNIGPLPDNYIYLVEQAARKYFLENNIPYESFEVSLKTPTIVKKNDEMLGWHEQIALDTDHKYEHVGKYIYDFYINNNVVKIERTTSSAAEGYRNLMFLATLGISQFIPGHSLEENAYHRIIGVNKNIRKEQERIAKEKRIEEEKRQKELDVQRREKVKERIREMHRQEQLKAQEEKRAREEEEKLAERKRLESQQEAEREEKLRLEKEQDRILKEKEELLKKEKEKENQQKIDDLMSF